MKRIIMLLPLLFILYSFQASASISKDISLGETIFARGLNVIFHENAGDNNEKQPSEERSVNLAEVEAKQTGILIAGVIVFLGAMFVVRKKVKKSINEKLNR